MATLKHKQASVKLNNTSVVIYYSYQGKEIRYPTGIKISSQKDTTGNFVEWDYTTRKLKLPPIVGDKVVIYMAMKEMKVKQDRIDFLLAKANDHINQTYLNNLPTIPMILEAYLKRIDSDKTEKANTGFFDYYEKFQERKRLHFEARV